MIMRKIYLLLLLMLASFSMMAQSEWTVTKDPRVDKQNHSAWGDANVISVTIKEDATIVFFEYITSRSVTDGWVSMSSSTRLYSKSASFSCQIIGWGIVEDDESTTLELDEQYSVRRDKRYILYMVFPGIPSDLTVFDIKEFLGSSGEFYWKGIHVNPRKSQSGTSELRKSDYTGSSSSSSSGISRAPSGRYSSSSSGYSSPSRLHSFSSSFEPTSSGTCFAVSQSGYVATCYHVVKDASKIRIRGVNGDYSTSYAAKVVKTDRENDLALLKITDNRFDGFGRIPYAISYNVLDVGERVFVLGFPLRALMGDEIKLTDGIVSASTGFQGDESSYQLTATVQLGNSGGPAFDNMGNVVGVVGARLAVENASYAVKSYYLRQLIMAEDLLMPMGSGDFQEMSLSEQVRTIKPFVYIIEVEE